MQVSMTVNGEQVTADVEPRMLLVHFLPKVPEYPRDGDAVHAAFLTDPLFAAVDASRAPRYRLDLLGRR